MSTFLNKPLYISQTFYIFAPSKTQFNLYEEISNHHYPVCPRHNGGAGKDIQDHQGSRGNGMS
jgi:hypothetical protein